MRAETFVSNKGFHGRANLSEDRGGPMSSVPLVPIQRLIHDVTGDLGVVVAASEQGFRETALEACLLAKEKLQAIREELLRPEPGIPDPRYDYDS
jgi:hypothetical protein